MNGCDSFDRISRSRTTYSIFCLAEDTLVFLTIFMAKSLPEGWWRTKMKLELLLKASLTHIDSGEPSPAENFNYTIVFYILIVATCFT